MQLDLSECERWCKFVLKKILLLSAATYCSQMIGAVAWCYRAQPCEHNRRLHQKSAPPPASFPALIWSFWIGSAPSIGLFPFPLLRVGRFPLPFPRSLTSFISQFSTVLQRDIRCDASNVTLKSDLATRNWTGLSAALFAAILAQSCGAAAGFVSWRALLLTLMSEWQHWQWQAEL